LATGGKGVSVKGSSQRTTD